MPIPGTDAVSLEAGSSTHVQVTFYLDLYSFRERERKRKLKTTFFNFVNENENRIELIGWNENENWNRYSLSNRTLFLVHFRSISFLVFFSFRIFVPNFRSIATEKYTYRTANITNCA